MEQTYERFSGTITRWLDRQGYGFIDCGDGKQVFVHLTDVVAPREGDRVSFLLSADREGRPKAIRVERLVEAQS